VAHKTKALHKRFDNLQPQYKNPHFKIHFFGFHFERFITVIIKEIDNQQEITASYHWQAIHFNLA
jgi:hypothetical protein